MKRPCRDPRHPHYAISNPVRRAHEYAKKYDQVHPSTREPSNGTNGMTPNLSIIITNYNEREYFRSVLQALAQEFSDQPEILVIDNASRDGSAAMVKAEFPNVTLIESPTNLMYGRGNNLGLARAVGAWILILNPDVAWAPGALAKFITTAQARPNVDVAAPRLTYRDGRTQINAHHAWPSPWTVFVDYCLPLQQLFMRIGHHPYQLSIAGHETTQVIAHATGACLLVRREVVRDIGPFDPQFTMYLEETDWQARAAAAGYQTWLMAESAITHFGSAQKTFAQASPHYLWGLRRYAEKHWTLSEQTALPPVVMAASVISLIAITLFFIPSFFVSSAGRRIRHYGLVYLKLLPRVVMWPKTMPKIS